MLRTWRNVVVVGGGGGGGCLTRVVMRHVLDGDLRLLIALLGRVVGKRTAEHRHEGDEARVVRLDPRRPRSNLNAPRMWYSAVSSGSGEDLDEVLALLDLDRGRVF